MEAAVGLDEEVVANIDEEVVTGMNEEVVVGMNEQVIASMDEEVVVSLNEVVVGGMDEEMVNANASRDMFEESVNEEPYRLSQVGAGVATQTALALSISEASFFEHLYI